MQYSQRTSSLSRVQIGRICMPISMKASTLSTNTIVSQTAYDGTRNRAGMRAPAVRATVMA